MKGESRFWELGRKCVPLYYACVVGDRERKGVKMESGALYGEGRGL